MVTDHLFILADETSVYLDKKTAERFYEAMLELNKQWGTSIVLVTHDLHLAERMDRILTIENGRLQNWQA